MSNTQSAVSAFVPALRLTCVCFLAFAGAYPLIVFGLGRLIVPEAADGSLVRTPAGQVIGSALIAQPFTKPEWFWPRPSAVGYNASAAAGSNLAPTNPALAERVRQTTATHMEAGDEVNDLHRLPLDLALASGSGLDPDITVDSARFQAPRVARARGVPLEQIHALIDAHASGSLAQVLTSSAPIVNVLRLNLALAQSSPH